MSEYDLLSDKKRRFVDEYLIDMNGAQAAIRAGYAPRSARQQASDLLTKPDIVAALQERRAALQKRTEITQDLVLERFWMIATADPNELVEYRRVCCRHCFGKDHSYQWINEAEYARYIASVEDGAPVQSDAGGYGFDNSLRPHPKCPQCHGEGHGYIHAHDTRDVSPAALALYAGAKQTKEGFEIKLNDQLGALDKIARHLGMYNDNVDRDKKDKLTPEQRAKRVADLLAKRKAAAGEASTQG